MESRLDDYTSWAAPLGNTITCLNACGQTITSYYRHDYVQCDCGAVAVDGGFDYARRGYIEGAQWEEWADAWTRDVREAQRLEAVA